MSVVEAAATPSLPRIYWILMKPRVILLLQITAVCAIAVHDMLAADSLRDLDFASLLRTSAVIIVGGTLAAGGSNAINMWYESESDALMERTKDRPIPRGWISPGHALLFGCIIALLGVLVVSLPVRGAWAWKAGFWCLFSVLFYVFVYTVLLKRRTAQNIVIGGVAGATPPLIGWAAAAGPSIHADEFALDLSVFDLGSTIPWLMFTLIFLWTPPHFWALALYRSEEYTKAGIPMLPSVKGAQRTLLEMKIYGFSLLALSSFPILFGELDLSFSVLTLLLGLWYLQSIFRIDVDEQLDQQGRLPSSLSSFLTSMKYLAAMFATLVLVAAVQDPTLSLLFACLALLLVRLATARFIRTS